MKKNITVQIELKSDSAIAKPAKILARAVYEALSGCAQVKRASVWYPYWDEDGKQGDKVLTIDGWS